MGKLRNEWKKAKVGYVNKVGSRLLSVDDNRGDFTLKKDLGPKLDDVEKSYGKLAKPKVSVDQSTEKKFMKTWKDCYGVLQTYSNEADKREESPMFRDAAKIVRRALTDIRDTLEKWEALVERKYKQYKKEQLDKQAAKR